MSTLLKRPSNANLGILLMAVAMLTVPIVDGIAKHLSATYSPLFLAWVRYVVATAIVLPWAAASRGRHVFPAERLGSHVMRTVFLVAAMTLYFLAIARIPLATAVSAYFIGPVLAVALAAFTLKEQLTRRKLLSVALGFFGSFVILRPGTVIDPGILLALGAGLLFALYLIATRQASKTGDAIKTLAFQCVIGTIVLTPQALAFGSAPSTRDWPIFLALGALSTVSHFLSIAAFRFGEASTLAPLVYLELIGAALIGYFAFGEVPGPFTVIGAAMIVAAGLLLLERKDTRDETFGGTESCAT